MTMGNGGTEGTGVSTLWINMYPLMSQRDVGEIVNAILRNFEPLGRLTRLLDSLLKRLVCDLHGVRHSSLPL